MVSKPIPRDERHRTILAALEEGPSHVHALARRVFGQYANQSDIWTTQGDLGTLRQEGKIEVRGVTYSRKEA